MLYEVSNYGRVKSLARSWVVEDRILKPNGDPTDNRLINLVWGIPKENNDEDKRLTWDFEMGGEISGWPSSENTMC
jgi:hypothetical protein